MSAPWPDPVDEVLGGDHVDLARKGAPASAAHGHSASTVCTDRQAPACAARVFIDHAYSQDASKATLTRRTKAPRQPRRIRRRCLAPDSASSRRRESEVQLVRPRRNGHEYRGMRAQAQMRVVLGARRARAAIEDGIRLRGLSWSGRAATLDPRDEAHAARMAAATDHRRTLNNGIRDGGRGPDPAGAQPQRGEHGSAVQRPPPRHESNATPARSSLPQPSPSRRVVQTF
jgi:hypothetical protein